MDWSLLRTGRFYGLVASADWSLQRPVKTDNANAVLAGVIRHDRVDADYRALTGGGIIAATRRRKT